MSKIIFAIIIFMTFISSCDNESEELDNSNLIGEWNWISTEGGIAAHIYETPLSTGKKITLIITKDYTYTIVENGIVITTGNYELTLKESIYNGEKKLFISSSHTENANQYIVITGILNSLNGNNLEIADNMYDGIGSCYERIE